MLIPDVNVLVSAFRRDAPRHERVREWLIGALTREAVGLTPAVASGTVRVLTHPRVFAVPDTAEQALAHLEALRANERVVDVVPGPRHWDIFAALCRAADARGNLVADADHAATAIEHDAMWITLDSDFARFAGLTWSFPGSIR